MRRAYGHELPRNLEEACDRQRLALIVHDMQVGVVRRTRAAAWLLLLVTATAPGVAAQRIGPSIQALASREPLILAEWPMGAAAPGASLRRPSLQIPDSVRKRAGYHHWKGAAIGGVLGGVGGLLLALAAHDSCIDCASDQPNVAVAGVVGVGVGGAIGFLAGLASPKYTWVPATSEPEAPRRGS